MPFYWNRWYRPNWRHRRYWRRRSRAFVRRKLWRRRRRRRPVRKRYRRKLRTITIKEFQPSTIKKLKIQGLFPLFMCNKERLSNNNTQWLFSTAPTHFPSGGGFSITQYTLSSLFELHDKALNWWTKSNNRLPLIRYSGCKFKLYRTQSTDYCFQYSNCFPMKATSYTYISTQPSMMMMNKKTVMVKCLETTKNKKPYVIVKCRPPEQMTTKWHFQYDLANVPLVMTLATAASFNRYYMSADAISTTIGFKTLNCQLFVHHNFQNTPTHGYTPKPNIWLWALPNGQHNIQTEPNKNLIFLGNPGLLDPGHTLLESKPASTPTQSWENVWTSYITNRQMWGNPFHPQYINGEKTILTTNKSPTQLKDLFKSSESTPIGTNFQTPVEPTYLECRYNPLADTGKDTRVYLVPNIRDETGWDPLNNKNLIVEGFPLWMCTWGYIDYQKQLREVQQIDINYILVFQSPFVTPKKDYYIPLDSGFFTNTSPFHPENELTPSDRTHFYPKFMFQMQTVNNIASCGPGTVKLPGTNSTEAHIGYTFYFKIGGCPAPMDTITDPTEQPIYPVPNNMHETNSLQSPTTAPETFLWTFDQRRDFLTKQAIERISKDWKPKETLFSTTGTTSMVPATTHQETSTSEETSTEEEEKKTFQEQLRVQRRKQRHLRLRILKLLKQLKTST
nr:MAG: ORF1 [TTV-like mini virus]